MVTYEQFRDTIKGKEKPNKETLIFLESLKKILLDFPLLKIKFIFPKKFADVDVVLICSKFPDWQGFPFLHLSCDSSYKLTIDINSRGKSLTRDLTKTLEPEIEKLKDTYKNLLIMIEYYEKIEAVNSLPLPIAEEISEELSLSENLAIIIKFVEEHSGKFSAKEKIWKCSYMLLGSQVLIYVWKDQQLKRISFDLHNLPTDYEDMKRKIRNMFELKIKMDWKWDPNQNNYIRVEEKYYDTNTTEVSFYELIVD